MTEFVSARVYDIHDAEREIKQLKEENLRLGRALAEQSQFFDSLSAHVQMLETELVKTKSDMVGLKKKAAEYAARYHASEPMLSPPTSPPSPSSVSGEGKSFAESTPAPFLPFSSTVVPSVMAEERRRVKVYRPPPSSPPPKPSGGSLNLEEEAAMAATFGDGDDAALMQFLAREHGMDDVAPVMPPPPAPTLRVGPIAGAAPPPRGREELAEKEREDDDPFGFTDSW